MVTQSWYLLFALVIILGAVFDFPWLVAFSLAVLGILAVGQGWNRRALKDVSYRRVWRYRRGFSGETFPIRIEIENRKVLPVSWLRVTDAWPLQVGPDDANTLAPSHIPDQGFLISLYSLRWFQRAVRTHTVLLRKRGLFPIGPYKMESGDLFGMYQSEQDIENIEYITVFPDLLDFKAFHLPTDDPFGDRHSRRRLFEDPNRPMGVRAYHPEDEFRRIHWPATARTGALQVKVYQPVSAQVMVVCLNVTTMRYHWLGTSPEMLEQLVKTCATVVYHASQDGYAVGLFSNGCLAHADQPFRIQPGRSRQQLAVLLQALAGVTSFVTGSFEPFLVRAMAQIPYGATLVLVTAFVTDELSEILLMLKRYRPHITVISLDETPPPEIPGVRMIHLPFSE